jgi:hypothetical protein
VEGVDHVVMSKSMTSTHMPRSLMANRIRIRIKFKFKTSNRHKVRHNLAVMWIPMQPMVAIKTTSRCGIQVLLNKGSNRCKAKVPQVSRGRQARDPPAVSPHVMPSVTRN